MHVPSTMNENSAVIMNKLDIKFRNKIRTDYKNIIIIKFNNTLQFDWFHKPTFLGRYLNFMSRHLHSQKRGAIVIWLAEPFYCLTRNSTSRTLILLDILQENDYPLEFIFETINARLKTLFYKQTHKYNNDNDSSANENTLGSPYIPNISDKFKNIVKDLNY